MRAAVLITALVAAVGCGAGSSATTATDRATTVAAPATSLSISVWSEGRDKGAPARYTLRCAPASGTVAKPAATCRKLTSMAGPFAPTPKDTVCTEQYGGPQQAIVSGTFEGRKLWIALSARNGCEISRWNRLAFLVPGAPGTGGGPA